MATTQSVTKDDQWSLAEAVDLPIALEEERDAPDREKELQATRAELLSGQTDGTINHAAVIHAWLRRWQNKVGGLTPGAQIEDALKNAARIAMAVGVLCGLATASDRLFFTGPEPLNVFALIGIFVFAPLALSAILILTVALRRPGQGTALQHFFIALGRKVVSIRERWAEPHVTLWTRSSSWNNITRSLGRNAILLQAPVLAISQRLALGFGIGLLLMLYIRVSFWELAFGWQSTLTAPESFWHGVTQMIAAPWSWIWPEGSPSLAQIVATRYSRMAGAAAVDPALSRAWWPFLAATIVFWSILVRMAVLVGLRVTQARRLRSFDPSLPDAELLLRRLLPGWSTSATSSAFADSRNGKVEEHPTLAPGVWHALIADEPDPAMPRENDLPNLIGMRVDKVSSFQFDDSQSAVTAGALEQVCAAGASVVLVMPASRDPIGEVSDTIRAVESAVQGRGGLIVLRGAPERLALWKRKLATWHVSLPAEYFPVG